MEPFLKELGIFGTGLLVWGGLITLTWKADEALADDPRLVLSNKLRGIEVRGDIEGWPDTFARMFDKVFGEKHLSWPCFLRSCVASYLAVTVVFFVWWTMNPEQAAIDWDKFGWGIFLGVAGLGGILNLLPDYLSLFETRIILRIMGRRPVRVAALLLMDALVTSLIILAPFVVLEYFVGKIPNRSDILTLSEKGVIGTFFYSTFFTSLWLWLYALAYGAMLVARKVGPVIQFLQYLLPLDTKPLRSLGLVSGGIGCIGYWVFGYVFIAPA